MQQIILNLWQKEYNNEFVFTQSSQDIYNFILKTNVSCLIVGPKFCGKKHLAYKISLQKNIKIILFDQLTEGEIVQEYDVCKLHNIQSIWIGDVSNIKKADIVSRINTLCVLKFEELSLEDMPNMLQQRLLYNDFKVDAYHLKACVVNLNCTYEDVYKFIEYVMLCNKLNNKIIHDYFFDINSQR